MAWVVLAPAERPLPHHRPSAAPAAGEARCFALRATADPGSYADCVGDGAIRGYTTAGGAAVAPPARLLSTSHPDAATAAPETAGDSRGAAVYGSAAASG